MQVYTINKNESVCVILHGTKAYNDAVALRYDVLRKPLNLFFTDEQLEAEKNNYHLVLYHNDLLIACLMLVPEKDGKIKMKQVAVATTYQGRGYGSKLITTAEKFSREHNFNYIYCHARNTALEFYTHLGYTVKGDMFYEVNIPHYFMEKYL